MERQLRSLLTQLLTCGTEIAGSNGEAEAHDELRLEADGILNPDVFDLAL
jgi:hypothetical protein